MTPSDDSREDRAAAILLKADRRVREEFAPIGQGSGGPRITGPALDAALRASGLRRHHYLAARLKWQCDDTVAPELERYLWPAAAGIARGWPRQTKSGAPYTRLLARSAIAEILTGKRVTGATMANLIGIDRSTWTRIHRARYEEVYRILAGWVDVAALVIAERR